MILFNLNIIVLYEETYKYIKYEFISIIFLQFFQLRMNSSWKIRFLIFIIW